MSPSTVPYAPPPGMNRPYMPSTAILRRSGVPKTIPHSGFQLPSTTYTLESGLIWSSRRPPPGPTTHFLWLDNGSGVRTRFKQLTDVFTEDGQTLTIDINPPRRVREILVQTLESPSWVAWREVRIFGRPLSAQDKNLNAPQLRLEKILDQLVLPVQITHAGDGSGRIFVVEQQGRITVVKDGLANEALFLDITDRVNCCEERGSLQHRLSPIVPGQPAVLPELFGCQ